MRPGLGNTFRELLTENDNAIANEYFKYMLEQHKPNGVVFLSGRVAFVASRSY